MTEKKIEPITIGGRIESLLLETVRTTVEFLVVGIILVPLFQSLAVDGIPAEVLWKLPLSAFAGSALYSLWSERSVVFGNSRQAALILAVRKSNEASLKALKISRKSFWSGTSDLIRIHQGFADHLSSFRDTYAEILEKSYK